MEERDSMIGSLMYRVRSLIAFDLDLDAIRELLVGDHSDEEIFLAYTAATLA